MDPLSVIASSIALSGTVSVALKAIYHTYRARPELLALVNEVTDLTTILRQIETLLLQGEQADDDLSKIASKAKTKLEELSQNVSKWATTSSRPGSVDGPPLRWLRIALKVKTFQEELRALRSRFKLVLPALVIQGSSRIQLDLKQIMLFARDTATNQDLTHSQFQSELVEHRDFLQTISEKLDSQSACHTVTTVPGLMNDSLTISSDTSEMVNRPFIADGPRDEEIVRAFHHNGSVLFESSQMTAISAVGIRTAQFPRSACQPWCSCECHLEHRIRSPPLLDQVIGSLFVGYSGMPGLRRKCNERLCHLRSQPMTCVTYFFPQWFLARVVSVVLSTTPLAGPVASLKVSRTVPGDSAIFTCAKTGDITRLRSLFENGLASPHDVHSESGITALHLAISHRQYSVCKLLLQANADPFLEDRTYWTAADNAWSKILSNSLDLESEKSLRDMFLATEYLERREFTVIHKIVLGMVSLDLEKELAASTAQINIPDRSQRTPLSLAAERSDSRFVAVLLKYGADANLASPCHGAPLHFAAMASDPACLSLLLEKGANVDSVTNWNQTPLHYVAAYTKDARHAEHLLAWGASPQFLDLDGIDPLGWVAITGNTPVAEVLLKRGVNVFNRDKSGDSPLVHCIRGHHHGVLRLLIKHGVCTELSLPGKERSWHVVAAEADVISMRILAEKTSNACVTKYGKSNLLQFVNIIRARIDSSDELISAFQVLVESWDNMCSEKPSSSDQDDIWEDAVEIM